jgi:uncharacterized protein (DUF362 family)
MDDQNTKINRKQFIERSIKAGAAITTTGSLSYLLYDSQGPTPFPENNENVTLPSFSIKPITGKTMSVISGTDREKCLNKGIGLLGGIERFITKGDIVAIKPNVAFASAPGLGATTHPDLLAAVIKLCKKAGASEVIIFDNPINAPSSCFYLSGIEKAAKDSGAKIMLPSGSMFRNTTLKNGKLIKNWPVFFTPLSKANKLIGIAPVKSHHRSGASMTMKNWYGLLGGRRNIFHQDIHTIISELAMLVTPTLVVLDGIDVMMTNGPTGGSLSDLERKNTLVLSCDQVAADAYGSSLLNMEIQELPFIKKAETAGVGVSDYKSLKPIYANVS